ncbi:MAG: preprotein translocase subunit SecG [Acidobacteriota bacterium]
MFTLLIILYVIVCVFLILVVLLQQGKGADVAAAFGGASTQASFGPRGTSTLMHKLTTASFVLFVVLCIGLAVMSGRKGRSVASGLKAATPASAPASPATEQQAPAEQQPAPAQQAPETK